MEHLNSTCMIHVYIMMRMKKHQGLNQARTCCSVRCLLGASRGVSGLSWVPGWFSRSLTFAVWVTQCFAAQAVTPLLASVETALQDPGHYSPPGSIGTRPSADCGAGEGTDKKPGKTRI